jgi:hydroxyacylglutathione hydrolase
MIEPLCFTGGMAQTNGFLLEGPGGLLLVDAPAGICEWLRRRDLRPAVLLLTHQHYDHVEDAAAVTDWSGCEVWAHSAPSRVLTLEDFLQSAGWPVAVAPFVVSRLVAGGEEAAACGWEIRAAHVPGHAADALVFHLPAAGLVFAGDTLFAGGVGRTDLPGGSWETLREGIERHLLGLPDETRLYPGHGEPSTIGRERVSNPFLA